MQAVSPILFLSKSRASLYNVEKLCPRVLNNYTRSLTTGCVRSEHIQNIRDEIMGKRQELLNMLREDAEKNGKQTTELEKAKKIVEELNGQDNQLAAQIEESITQHGQDIKGVQEAYKYQQINQILEQKLQQFKQQKAEKLKLLRERYETETQELQKKYDREKQFRQKKFEHEQFLMKKLQELIQRRKATSDNIYTIYRNYGATIEAELKVLALQHEWNEFENQHNWEIEQAKRQFELVEIEFLVENNTE
jgi:DNA repair exonuclease SbcCD ATPase subunit